jgi:hypothetical protein
MLALAQDHASNIAQSQAVRVSAIRDREQVELGGGKSDYFASRMYTQKQPLQQRRMEPPGYRDDDSMDRMGDSRGMSVAASQDTLFPSRSPVSQSGVGEGELMGESNASSRSAINQPQQYQSQPQGQGLGRIDDLGTEEGIRRQEEKLRQLRSRVLQSGGGNTLQQNREELTPSLSGPQLRPQNGAQQRRDDLAGFEAPAYTKQLYEESKAQRMGSNRLSVDGQSLSSADYLEKWLRNEVSEEDGSLLSPPKVKGLVPSGSQRSVGSSVDDRRDRARPRDALDLEVGGAGVSRRQLEVEESSEEHMLRSRSSHQAMRPEGSPHPPQPQLSKDSDGRGGDYVYDKNFDQQQRRREGGRNQQRQQQQKQEEGGGYGRGGFQKGADPPSYAQQQSGNPYYPQQGMPPYGMSPNMMGGPYGMGPGQTPYGGPPGIGMGMPPYGYGHGGYGMQPPQHPHSFPMHPYGGMPNPYAPPQQSYPQMPYGPQQPPMGQPPPGPAPQDAGYLRELQELADQLERENASLSAVGASASASARDRSAGGASKGQDPLRSSADGRKESPVPSYLEPTEGRRLNRAELKHRDEMRQMQFEMEKLKQSQALEDLKGDMERRRAAKKAENDHEVRLDLGFRYQ